MKKKTIFFIFSIITTFIVGFIFIPKLIAGYANRQYKKDMPEIDFDKLDSEVIKTENEGNVNNDF